MPAGAVLSSSIRGICCCHSDPDCIEVNGTLISGSSDVSFGGSPAARVGDLAIGDCGHFGMVGSGSTSVLCNGMPTAVSGVSVILPLCITGLVTSGCESVSIL